MILDYITESFEDRVLKGLASRIITLKEYDREEMAEKTEEIKRMAAMYLALVMFKNKKALVKPEVVKDAIKKFGVQYNGEELDDEGGNRFVKFGGVGAGAEAMLTPNKQQSGKYDVYDVGGLGHHGKTLIETLRMLISKNPEILDHATEIANYIKKEGQKITQTIATIAGPKKDAKGREIKAKGKGGRKFRVPELKDVAKYEFDPQAEIERLSKEIKQLN